MVDILIHKRRETYGCILSAVAIDALVLKYQAIRIPGADWKTSLLEKSHAK